MSSARFTALLERALGSRIESMRPVSGGDINEALAVHTASTSVFVKKGRSSARTMFEAEAAGLLQLAQTNVLRVPAVIAVDGDERHAFIALEWLELRSASAHTDHVLGERLARLHQTTSTQFGWSRDNTIGLTLQSNTSSSDWTHFWRTRRLEPQLELARQNGASSRLLDKGARLSERLEHILQGHQPQPALIHGDLWSGNRAADPAGEPVMFDPAVYFADREVELALMKLFGGFHHECYRAYEANAPLPAGHERRLPLYQLYHVLNHFNLFGGAYAHQAEQLIERLLHA